MGGWAGGWASGWTDVSVGVCACIMCRCMHGEGGEGGEESRGVGWKEVALAVLTFLPCAFFKHNNRVMAHLSLVCTVLYVL